MAPALKHKMFPMLKCQYAVETQGFTTLLLQIPTRYLNKDCILRVLKEASKLSKQSPRCLLQLPHGYRNSIPKTRGYSLAKEEDLTCVHRCAPDCKHGSRTFTGRPRKS